jgi:hypothetical protein
VGTSEVRGKQWKTTPKNLPQNAACQSHTVCLTGPWFLPKPAQGLNTNQSINFLIVGSAMGILHAMVVGRVDDVAEIPAAPVSSG